MDQQYGKSLWEVAKRSGITRRRFLALLAIGGGGAALASCGARLGLTPPLEPSSPGEAGPPASGVEPTTAIAPTSTEFSPPSNANASTPANSAETSVPLASGLPRDLADANPAEVDNSQLPITPIDDIGVIGPSRDVDIATYELSVDGLVNNPLSLSYQDLLQRPTVTQAVLLVCPGFLAANPEWTGVPVSALLAETGIRPVATHIIFYSIDGSFRDFALADLTWDGLFLAHTVDGQILPNKHGYPLRLIQKGHYGASWLKWVNRISIT